MRSEGGRGVVIPVIGLASALACVLSLLAHFGHPHWWALPTLALAVAGSELAVVHFQIGRQPWRMSTTEILLTFVFVLQPGTWMVLMAPAGVAVAELIRRRRAEQIVANVAVFAAATAAGSYAVVLAHDGGLPRLTSAGLATAGFWIVLTPLSVALRARTGGAPGSRRRSVRFATLFARNAPVAFVHTASSVAVGLLAGWLALTAPIGLLALLVPIVLLWSSFDLNRQRSNEAQLYAELARGQEQAGGSSIDASAQVVLTAAARLLGNATVEILVFAFDGLVRYQGDDRTLPVHSRVGIDALDRPWVTEALAGGFVTGAYDGVTFCAARIGPPDRPLALLRATRPYGRVAGGRGPLDRHDATMMRLLVTQAESWLSVADLAAARDAAVARASAADHSARALGDLGVGTLPALGVLRESSSRLARLARLSAEPDDVASIVDELHTVERAVASLLGAIALAADTDLELAGVAFPPERPVPVREAEWTSSGTIR